jgi:hypothetical protein
MTMRKISQMMMIAIFGRVLAVIVCGVRLHSAAAAPQAVAGASLRARDRLAELDDPKLTGAQKAKLGVVLLQDEIDDPTPHPLPGADDGRAHCDVLAALVAHLRGADADSLRQSWQSGKGELRSTLAVQLVLDGAPEPEREVRELLRDQQRHHLPMRLLAAEALRDVAGRTGDTELGRTFAELIEKELQWRPLPGSKSRGEFPVRKVLAEAIGKLQKRKVPLDSYVPAAVTAYPQEFTFPASDQSRAQAAKPR